MTPDAAPNPGARFAAMDGPPPGMRFGRADGLDPAILVRPVLIVEDEAMIAWLLESLLEEMGFTDIAISPSGPDAIEQAKRAAPALVLSDINLGAGEMDGVAAAAAITADTGAPVVFITAFASTEARRRIAEGLPGASLLRKPVNELDLRRAIVDVTDHAGKLKGKAKG